MIYGAIGAAGGATRRGCRTPGALSLVLAKESVPDPERKAAWVRWFAGEWVLLGGSTYIGWYPVDFTRLGCCLFRATALCAGALTGLFVRGVRQWHPNLA